MLAKRDSIYQRNYYSSQERPQTSANELKNTGQVHKKLNKKRVLYVIILIFILINGFSMSIHQSHRLKEKEAELKEAKKEYKKVLATNKELKSTVKKLDDDEYILKLARKEYFLSRDGELLFQLEQK